MAFNCQCMWQLIVLSGLLGFVYTEPDKPLPQSWIVNGRNEGSILTQRLASVARSNFNWSIPKPDANWRTDCPTWITDYIKFHKATRGTPGAKYIIHSCPDNAICNFGLGDRLRGLLPAFQLAKGYNRVLLIAWDSPRPLETYLQPSSMNWSLTADLEIDWRKAARMHRFNFDLTNPGVSQEAQAWRISTNALQIKQESGHPADNPFFRRVSWDSHCIFRHLFQPTAELIQATDAIQLDLLGNLDKPFVAVHLRMGHLSGEAVDVPRGWDHFQGILAAYKCATERDALLNNDTGFGSPKASKRKHSRWRMAQSTIVSRRALAQQAGPEGQQPNDVSPLKGPQPRILVLTDHAKLRDMIGNGMLQGVTGPSYAAHHLSESHDLEHGQHAEKMMMSIMADFLLLTRAYCLVWGKSGFSQIAMAYGWHKCAVQVELCIENMF